ncbi:hypothetical protein NECID01_1981 [Nematocida sp. AWRm77]|nr:hypothetical protein NECID01_1981 [Nematocida sp. AWRm77]
MAEKDPSVHKEKTAKSLKSVQAPAASEGAVITNTALNAYAMEYMKDPSNETYALLEEEGEYAKSEESVVLDARTFLLGRKPSILSVLVSALVDSGEVSVVAPEEERKKRLSAKNENFAQVNQQIATLCARTLITQKDIESNAGSLKKQIGMYEDVLQKIMSTNRRNKRAIISRRKEHFAHFFFLSLLESVDSSIESVYTKKYKAKKKKKEEEGSYYVEMEKLLENRESLKLLCQSIPESMLEMPSEEVGIENVLDTLSKEEHELAKAFLPEKFFSAWKEA